MTGSATPSSRVDLRLLVGLTVCLVLLFLGWRAFWHLTDDAHILYRYASNAMAGRGLVWNPEPFAPVEGYSEFLWLLVLVAVWTVTGVEPPDAANVLGLLLGCATFLMICRLAFQLRLPEALRPHRWLVTLLIALAMATNRVFFASMSTGLGTALFQFCLFAWLSLLLGMRGSWSRGRGMALSFMAALCGLCRPDGYLAVLATMLLLAHQCWARRQGLRRCASMALPLLLVAIHIVWRRLYYASWLPNTYFAKNVAPWPESGVRYLASFLFEFGGWLWLALAVLFCARRLRELAAGRRRLQPFSPPFAAGAVVLCHLGYYTLVIGGDMFEYRVYTHLFPLQLLTAVAMAAELWPRPRPVLLWLSGLVLAALPVPWLKHAHGDGPIREHVPAVVRPLASVYDDWQRWLMLHMCCLRNQAMRGFVQLQESLPTREQGSRISWDGMPVHAGGLIGLLGWVLPNVAIIDSWGLNDYVVARHPIGSRDERERDQLALLSRVFVDFDQDRSGRVDGAEIAAGLVRLRPQLRHRPLELQATAQRCLAEYDVDLDGAVAWDEVLGRVDMGGDRRMGHDRFPPPGYVEGFLPNVVVENGQVRVEPRPAPLTAEQVRAHEARFRALADTWK